MIIKTLVIKYGLYRIKKKWRYGNLRYAIWESFKVSWLFSFITEDISGILIKVNDWLYKIAKCCSNSWQARSNPHSSHVLPAFRSLFFPSSLKKSPHSLMRCTHSHFNFLLSSNRRCCNYVGREALSSTQKENARTFSLKSPEITEPGAENCCSTTISNTLIEV